MRWFAVSLLLCLGFPFGGRAQQGMPVYQTYTVNEGLPSNELYAALEDRQGYLWLATDRGACRYDGKYFKTYTRINGLADNSILDIDMDAKGRVWMMSANRKLSWYENGRVHNYPGNEYLSKAIQHNYIVSLGTDEEDQLFIGTKGGLYKSGLNDSIPLLVLDTSATPARLNIIELNDHLVHYRSIKNQGNGISLSGQHFLPNYPEKELSWSGHEKPFLLTPDLLLVNLAKRLVWYDRKEDTLAIREFDRTILNILVDQEGHLWLTFRAGGALRLEGPHPSARIEHKLFGNESVTSVFQDRTGGFWFTTIGKGLHYIPSMECLTLRPGEQLNGATPSCFLGRPDGSVWVGYQDGGIDVCNVNGVVPLELEELSHVEVRQLTSYQDDQVIACLSSGEVYLINGNDYSLEMITNKGVRHFPGDDRELWQAGMGGIQKTDPQNWNSRSSYPFPTELIRDVIGDGKGGIYLATFEGLKHYRPSQGKITSVLPDDPRLQERVEKIERIGETLILATRGKGVVFLQGNGEDSSWNRIWNIGEKEGLASNLSNHVFAESDSVIWVSTHKGLNKLILAPDKRLRKISVYNFHDGLASNQVLGAWAHQGRKWTFSSAGLSTFGPNYQPNFKASPFYLTSLQIDQQDTLVRPHYSLPHHKNDFHFGFQAIAFRRKPAFGYQYKLQGLSNEWTYTTDTSANFTELLPGEYSFLVRAVTRPGNPATQTLSLPFVIKSPWYSNPWLQLLLLLMVPIGIGLIAWGRARRLRQRIAIERNITELKAQALRSQINPHFAFNALNTVQHFITLGEPEIAISQLGKFSALLRLVLRTSDQEWIRMEDEIKMLELYLELESQRFEGEFDKEISIDPSFDPAFDRIPPMILQPFVENSIWHGLLPKKGERKLSIRFSRKGQQAHCIIEDNGVGRDFHTHSQKEGHFSIGISVTRKRLELTRDRDQKPGKVSIEDLFDPEGKPAGTRVLLEIPLN